MKEERHKRFDERFGYYWTRINGNVYSRCNEDDKTPIILETESIKSFIDTEVDLAVAEAYKRGVEECRVIYQEEMRKKMSNMGKISMSKLTKKQKIEKAIKASHSREIIKKENAKRLKKYIGNNLFK